MGYKSRNLYPQGGNVSEEHWNSIFKGKKDESSTDDTNDTTECDQNSTDSKR